MMAQAELHQSPHQCTDFHARVRHPSQGLPIATRILQA